MREERITRDEWLAAVRASGLGDLSLVAAVVLETDAPDIPPQWLYATAAERAAGRPQGLNTPAELPRIGEVIAGLRGMAPTELAEATSANAVRALPRLAALAPVTS